ncbi:hypothetical protein [Mycobacterium sp. DL440]|uniref:hypothetical protein n=1 Tax=Mycobacterium sp. DL440 TaxID=2675523 RepID=UPI00142232C6|nr:hypothetical protein [Mycobacterium sp. DL440]
MSVIFYIDGDAVRRNGLPDSTWRRSIVPEVSYAKYRRGESSNPHHESGAGGIRRFAAGEKDTEP